jgi:hypothetical protein
MNEPNGFDDAIKRLNDALKNEEARSQRIENIANLLNLSDEDKRCLSDFELHFRDPNHPFDEKSLKTEFKEEIKINGTERLYYDTQYRQKIADIYDSYLK